MTRSFLNLSALLLCALLHGCANVDVGGPTVDSEDPDAGRLIVGSRVFYVRPEALAYSGRGRYEWPDGSSYEGEWQAGQPNGQGVRQDSAGHRYQGNFADGLPQGQGTYQSALGDTYSGAWQGGQRHGSGRFQDRHGTVYEGAWIADVRDGFGAQREADGAYYEGGWQDDAKHGYGEFDNGAGLSYEGMWSAGLRAGFGKQTRPDGSTYEGEWEADQRQGSGKETALDGSAHEGQWELDRALGSGRRTLANGILIDGLWTGRYIRSGFVTLPSGAQYAGRLYARRNTVVQAEFLAWLNSTASAGDPSAMLLLATTLLDYEDPQPDPRAARQWLERAAAAGQADAQFRLAGLVNTPATVAISYLQQAAAQNHRGAHERLGNHHVKADPPDLERGAKHYRAALQLGSDRARNNLAWLLATRTDSTLFDPAQAVALIRPLAISFGHWQHLDTLAAALAASGDFTTAVETQLAALEDLQGSRNSEQQQQAQQQRSMLQRLALYQNQTPYQESAR